MVMVNILKIDILWKDKIIEIKSKYLGRYT